MQLLYIITFTLLSVYGAQAGFDGFQPFSPFSRNDGYTTLAYWPVVIRQLKPTSAPAPPPARAPAAAVQTNTVTVTAPAITQTQTQTQTLTQTQTETKTETKTETAPEKLQTAFDNANAWCQKYNGPSSNGILDGQGNHLACTPMKPGCP